MIFNFKINNTNQVVVIVMADSFFIKWRCWRISGGSLSIGKLPDALKDYRTMIPRQKQGAYSK